MDATVRPPAVAGRFYPGKADALLRDLHTYTTNGADLTEQNIRAIGCVVPHAGYMYSGHVAGAVYSHLDLPRRFIIMCPNHTGMGEPLSINSTGCWLTPLGEAQVDEDLAELLKSHLSNLRDDTLAHRSEHATEVQLPFLQALVPDFRFVPITVGISRLEVLQALGDAIAATLSDLNDRVLIISSSDMNHYEPDKPTRIKDAKAIERIVSLDPEGLHHVVTTENITMCGFGPTVAMLTAAKRLGATRAQLIKYATSADISGDYDYCVGYAGIAVT